MAEVAARAMAEVAARAMAEEGARVRAGDTVTAAITGGAVTAARAPAEGS
jgi:hypothetical protein